MKVKTAILLISLILLSSCALKGTEGNPVFRTKNDLLGTVISMTVYENIKEKAIDSAFARVSEIDSAMTLTAPQSELSLLNAQSGSIVRITGETLAVISEGLRYSAMSGGAFDISIGPLVKLWDITGTNPHVPDSQDILTAKGHVGYGRVEIDSVSASVRIEKDMSIDLGGIAKGYACNEAVRVLRENNVRHAILDFGGNIYAIGKKPAGTNWKIAIKAPVIGESGYLAILEVSDTAVVTSGPYERYFEQDGKVYHHIIDPATGYPVQSGLLSVTIVCEDSMKADALSTACFVLGAEKGMALLDNIPGAQGVFVCEDYSVRVTKGLTDRFFLLDDRFDLYEKDFA